MKYARLFAALAVMLTAGCGDFLEPDPNDILAPENFYKTGSDAVAAVNSVYEQMRWMHWLGYWYMSDVATDDVGASPNFGSDGHRMSQYTFDAREWVFGGVWGDAYRSINRANAVLERVPGISMDAGLKKRVLGEAHFLRALAYFTLVRFYGDVPLIDKEVKSLEGLDVARTPTTQVYALIISDLEAAGTDLPANYGGSDLGRATSGAAQSLLAKVYLAQGNWAQAAATAGQVMGTGRYALLPDWHDVFAISQELSNSESIFELNYDGVLNPGAGSVHTLFLLPSGFPGGDAYGLMLVAPSLVSLFAANDVRGNGGSFITSPYTDGAGRTATWAVPNGPAVAKYLDQTNTQNMNARGWAQQSNNWIILRYADVLLMYAEAVNEGGSVTSGPKEAALNAVRIRAGIAPVAAGLSQAAFRDSVRVERRREFVFEGQRWFDLSRWGTLADAMAAKFTQLGLSGRVPPSNLMPIPGGEIDRNPNLTQNPGY